MNRDTLGEELFSTLDQPLILVNGSHNIVNINSRARGIFGFKDSEGFNLTLGEMLYCNNALNIGACGTTKHCHQCQINLVIAKVLRTNKAVHNQLGIVCITNNSEEWKWQITFNAYPVNNEKKTVLLALKSADIKRAKQEGDNKPESDSQLPYNDIIIRDLSKEQRIREQAGLHRSALEFAPSKFYYLNSDGLILYANRNARRDSGPLSANQLIFDINTTIDSEWWHTIVEFVKEEEYISFEATHKNNEGKLFPVMVHIFMPDSNLDNLFCYYCHDITNRKEIEEKMLKESRYNQTLAEISRELTVHSKHYSVELLVRQYAMQITDSLFSFLAYRHPVTKELITTVYADPPGDYDDKIKQIEAFFQNGVNHHDENDKENIQTSISDILINDSSSFYIGANSINHLIPFQRIATTGVFFDGIYKGLLLVAGKSSDYSAEDHDRLKNLANLFALAINRIQENNKLSETVDKLETAIGEAIAANKAKSAFLARISHEIRTPLNAIIGFTDVLNGIVNDSTQKDYLASIKKSGQNLLGLINDILDFSKIEAGKIVLKPRPINMRQVIVETQKMFLPSLQEKKLTFTASVNEEMPELIMLDELQLRQILVNLIGNAVKFTEKGSIELYIEADPPIKDKTDLTIRVSDTGIGIKPESQKLIFEDFTQQEDQDNRRYGGTGLGLGIVKSIVGLIDGDINVESTPGKGSVFTVTLRNCPLTNHAKEEKLKAEIQELNTIEIKKEKKITNAVYISNECLEDMQNIFSGPWESFRHRPSFKDVPQISNVLGHLAQKHDNQTLRQFATAMKDSASTFDVESLHKIIAKMEQYLNLRS